MVPSLGVELSGEPALFDEVWSWGTKALRSESSRAVFDAPASHAATRPASSPPGVGVVRS